MVSSRAPTTTRAPIGGVAIRPRRSTIRPPPQAPSAMPRLKAAMFRPEAMSTACGTSRSARCTTYSCRAGTLPKATAPQASTVATTSTGCGAVKLSTASTPVMLKWLVVVKLCSPGITASGRRPSRFATRMKLNSKEAHVATCRNADSKKALRW